MKVNRRKLLVISSTAATVSLAGCVEPSQEPLEYEWDDSEYLSEWESAKEENLISNDRFRYKLYFNEDKFIENNIIVSVYDRDEENHLNSKELFTGERKIEFQKNGNSAINNLEFLIIQGGEIEYSNFGMAQGVNGGEIIERIKAKKI